MAAVQSAEQVLGAAALFLFKSLFFSENPAEMQICDGITDALPRVMTVL